MSLPLDAAYLLLLLAISPWLAYRSWRTGRYRRGWSEKLWGAVPISSSDGPVIWLHAVSVGEVNLLQSLIGRLEQSVPGCCCVISATTDTGYALAKKKYGPRTVFYCPLDFSWAVRRAMRRVRPDLLVLAELELWPNLIAAASRHGAKMAVVNGRMSDRSAKGYARIGFLLRRLLRRVDCVAVQTEAYAERFRQLGASSSSVVVTGSVKFDGAATDRRQSSTRELAELAGFEERHRVFLAGSTQAPEESLALDAYLAYRERHPELRLVLVPRHPERSDEVAKLLEVAGLDYCRRSQLSQRRSAPEALLIDVVGELGAWWGRADIAYVGGSMGRRGGQNMIEPAAFGCPVSFGPETRNFRDIVDLLLTHEAAVVVRHGGELEAFVERCLQEPVWSAALGARAQQLVIGQQGAADLTVKRLTSLLPALPKQKAA